MYDKDFNYFMEHQIAIGCSNNGKHVVFFSLLNGERFKTIDGNKEFTDSEIRKECLNIHKTVEYYN